MFGPAILRRDPNGVPVECVIPRLGYEGPDYEGLRGGTPHLAQIKVSGRNFVPTLTRAQKGSRSYVEPQVNYCSTASQFETVRNGLITHPTWKRSDFKTLLRIQYAYRPTVRHLHAGYAFQRDGTVKTEYAEPLAIYARSHPELVAEYKAARLHEGKRQINLGLGSSSRMNARTNKNVLPPSGLHLRATGSRAIVAAQRQVTASPETDEEDTSDTEDERENRNRGREPSEDTEEAPWRAKIREGYELRESLKKRQQMTRDSFRRRGLSPEPHRTRLRN